MSHHNHYKFKFFLPDARLLKDEEIADFKATSGSPGPDAQKNGLWIEIGCPEGSCLDGGGRLRLPVSGGQSQGKGVFLNLFCPEGSCEIVESTDVP